jgi:hypothetical protein
MQPVIADLKATNKNGCNDNCIKVAQALKDLLQVWVTFNC